MATNIGNNLDNIIRGKAFVDQLFGLGGNDRLFGNAGDDRIDGGAGSDFVDGGIGNDRVQGGDGNDLVYGGDGSDVVNGGAGSDFLIGGDGADRFEFNKSHLGTPKGAVKPGKDMILDFEAGVDKISFQKGMSGITKLTDITKKLKAIDGGVLIDLGNGNTITVQDVSLKDMKAHLSKYFTILN